MSLPSCLKLCICLRVPGSDFTRAVSTGTGASRPSEEMAAPGASPGRGKPGCCVTRDGLSEVVAEVLS